mmetsp:Transcript_2962/g.6394  ORF Transcript_2962/g.6394 Transcript_2962/m.6394 type:complete len:355 (-) Transcript_2962:32-1096(-)
MVSISDIVGFECILAPHSALMEKSERNDSLEDTNSLPTEHTTKTKLGRVPCNLLACFDNANGLSTDGGSLHDNLKSTEGVRHKDVNWTDNARCNKTCCSATQRRFIPKFLLDIFLQAGLTHKAQGRRCKGMAHERHSATEERSKSLGCRFPEDLQDWLDCTRLLEVCTLLLLNHADWVNKRRRKDGRASCSYHSGVLALLHEEGNAEENAKLRDALETNTNEAGSNSRQRGRDRSRLEDSTGLGHRNFGIHSVSLKILRILLDKLPVGRHRVIHDGLKRGASKISRHSLKLGQTSLLDDKVFIGHKRNTHLWYWIFCQLLERTTTTTLWARLSVLFGCCGPRRKETRPGKSYAT